MTSDEPAAIRPQAITAAANAIHHRCYDPTDGTPRLPDTDETLAAAALEAALPHLAAAERERIRRLADNHEARRTCLECGAYAEPLRNPCCPKSFWFADLLREQQSELGVVNP